MKSNWKMEALQIIISKIPFEVIWIRRIYRKSPQRHTLGRVQLHAIISLIRMENVSLKLEMCQRDVKTLLVCLWHWLMHFSTFKAWIFFWRVASRLLLYSLVQRHYFIAVRTSLRLILMKSSFHLPRPFGSYCNSRKHL